MGLFVKCEAPKGKKSVLIAVLIVKDFGVWKYFSIYFLQRHIVVDTFFGYDEESMDSETSSVASFRMDRTPATPDEDLDDV